MRFTNLIILCFLTFLTTFLLFAETPSTCDNFYIRLGLQPNATVEDIKKAHRELSKIWHPDKEKGSEDDMKALNEARDTLLDSKLRKEYDELINSPTGVSGGSTYTDAKTSQQELNELKTAIREDDRLDASETEEQIVATFTRVANIKNRNEFVAAVASYAQNSSGDSLSKRSILLDFWGHRFFFASELKIEHLATLGRNISYSIDGRLYFSRRVTERYLSLVSQKYGDYEMLKRAGHMATSSRSLFAILKPTGGDDSPLISLSFEAMERYLKKVDPELSDVSSHMKVFNETVLLPAAEEGAKLGRQGVSFDWPP